jgi:hypothetical protein
MSLINEALKQARKAPPRNLPSSLPPLPPAAEESWSLPGWFLPAVAVILIIAAIFFIGWASARHSVRKAAQVPTETVETPPPAAAAPPAAATPPPAEVSAPAVNPPDAPKLQGIFYSPTDPSAIIDGKTVRLGDPFRQYHVKAISKYTVTLVGPDHKEMQIGMEN